MKKDFKIGDKVLVGNFIGVLVQEYQKGPAFDWEVAFINKAPCGCWLDCYKESELQLYNWKSYPKTLLDTIKLVFKNDK